MRVNVAFCEIYSSKMLLIFLIFHETLVPADGENYWR